MQYPAGIIAEHKAVRTAAGMFDVSHMGEFEITGPDRNAFVNRVTSNDVAALEPGQVQYSAILTSEGTFVDDCPVYRFDDKLMMVVNASNVARAWAHIVDAEGRRQRPAQGHHRRRGAARGAGPDGRRRSSAAHRAPVSPTSSYYHFAEGKVAGAAVHHLPHRLHRRGRLRAVLPRARHRRRSGTRSPAAGATPIGLGARDSLRLEMGKALYGNDIDDTITPLEAGLGWIVKLDKGAPFIGDAALRAQKVRGVTRKLVGFRARGRGFPRHGYPVFYEGREVDIVRSGTMSPSLGTAIGTTYLPAAAARRRAPGSRSRSGASACRPRW